MFTYFKMKKNEWKIRNAIYNSILGFMKNKQDIVNTAKKLFDSVKDMSDALMVNKKCIRAILYTVIMMYSVYSVGNNKYAFYSLLLLQNQYQKHVITDISALQIISLRKTNCVACMLQSRPSEPSVLRCRTLASYVPLR